MARFVVRYGVMRMVGVFSSRADQHRRGTLVVARTPRGLEIGEVLCEATEQALAQLSDPPSGQILREATPEDRNEAEHLLTRQRDEFAACQKHVDHLRLVMQLVDVEHLFGGERIIVYYLAEERVDFRELIKALASEFQTRIEMRQIGVRDEAKLLADYGDCGKPVCCNTHLVEMPPVSMKMAKLQKATLDPTKISGRCGRLKCCLRYEYDTYEELQKTLPPIGAEVVTTTGRARILNQEILTQQLLVQTEDNRRLLVPASDVLTVLSTSGGGRPRSDRGERSDRTERSDRGERSERGEKGDSTERRETGDKGGGKREPSQRGESRPERGPRLDRRERGERGDRGERGERTDRRTRGGDGERAVPPAADDAPPTPREAELDATESSSPTSHSPTSQSPAPQPPVAPPPEPLEPEQRASERPADPDAGEPPGSVE